MRSSHDFDLRRELAVWRSPTAIDVTRLLFWSWYEPRNFGDWIGPYLFEAITGLPPIFCPREKVANFGCMMTVGSILRHLTHNDCVAVWGSGIISLSDVFKRPKVVHAVRGPLTRQRFLALGYECPEVFGDPAILLPDFYQPERREPDIPFGFIPHFVDRHLFVDNRNCRVIDPTLPIERVIDKIVTCRMTLSSSLHGLIVSHAFGIPAVWVRPVNQIDGDNAKFHDYLLSVGADTRPLAIDGLGEQALRAIERTATLPDHAALRESLRRSCPFRASASTMLNSKHGTQK